MLARNSGGVSTAIILGVNAIGAALPLFGHSTAWLAASALVFGVSFFAVVGSTTAFVRFNYPPAAWPTAIAAMTIAFGVGHTLGPTATGAITDALGEPVLRPECRGGDAGIGCDCDGVSGAAGAKILRWARILFFAPHTTRIQEIGIRSGCRFTA